MYRHTAVFALSLAPVLWGAPGGVSFSQPPGNVEVYDFVEVDGQILRGRTRAIRSRTQR